MTSRALSYALAISIAAGGVGCLLTIPFDELSREASHDAGAAEVSDAHEDGATADVPELGPDGEAGGDLDADDAADDAAGDAGTCANKVVDGDETDVDCGGSCPRCGNNRKCKDDGDCQSTNCDGGRCATCPVDMLRVPVGALAYCIDPTEVTIAQYDAFVAANDPATTSFPTQCKWKASGSFAPTPKPSGGANAPVRNVDWCDAWAYCHASGKRLCGAITTSSTSKPPAPFDKYDDPNVGQWRHACSYGPSPVWPYGASADPTKCNTSDRPLDGGVTSVVAVRPLTGCVGAPAELNGLYDMSGNVAEWEDSCSGTSGAGDICRVRGGSFRDRASASSCGVATTRNRGDRHDWVGFRCCRP